MPNKSWLKKGMVLGIILLFVGTSIGSAINTLSSDGLQPLKRGNWLYVGGSGPGNYTSIQTAINNANNGNTVYVYDDSSPYREAITINYLYNITLIGEDKDTTVIDGQGSFEVILCFHTGNVLISGFSITNGTIGVEFGGSNENNNMTVKNNNIYGNHYGIWAHTYNHTIIENNIFNNSDYGVCLNGHNIAVYHNNIYQNNPNAVDTGNNNLWYNPVAQEGNYYGDYNGIDLDEDGIGETPYPIPFSTTQDLYPLVGMYPLKLTADFLWDFIKAGQDYQNISFTSVSFSGNTKIVNYTWTLGDGSICYGRNISYNYTQRKKFNVSLSITDNESNTSSVSKIVFVGVHNIISNKWYSSIQKAINEANNGDSIHADNFTYFENLIINKSINLIGENRINTIIDGRNFGDVIQTTAMSINLSGFTIKNSSNNRYDACIDIGSSYNIITNCIIYNKHSGGDDYWGIYIHSPYNYVINNDIKYGFATLYLTSSYCTIKGNNISNAEVFISSSNNYIGNNILNSAYLRLDENAHWNNVYNNTLKSSNIVLVNNCDHNKIYNNTILNVAKGIVLAQGAICGDHDYNEIYNNYIDCNNISESIGITLDDDSDYNKIINNTITNVTSVGIFILGWYGTGSDNNYFDGNIIYCSYIGMYIHASCGGQILRNNSMFHSSIFIYSDNNYDIDSSNTVNGKPIYYYKGINNTTVPSDAGQVILKNCNSCTISGSNFSDGTIGIILIGGGSSQNNTIYSNTFTKMKMYPILIPYESSDYNHIYHNNFFNNYQHVEDYSNNSWDDGYPSGGNYWDDYTGEDTNGDHIGDIPYNISGGSNKDNYPLMGTYGPPNAHFTYTRQGMTVIFNASSSYDYNGNIVSYNWDFGDGSSGSGCILSHTYIAVGSYPVVLTVTDNEGKQDTTSKIILINLSPVFGSPNPANGSTNNPLSFTWGIPINDPEGDQFSWTIQCSNGQTNSGTGSTNGTKTLALSGLAYSTSYHVWVNATDPSGSGIYTRKWYTFTTKTSLPPVFGTPTPTNGSTNNPLSFTWGIPINDPEGDQFSWTIQCSNGQTNSGTGATNGTKSLALSGLGYLKTYKVWVNATDPTGSGLYTRKWYTFTTQQQQNVPPNKPNRPSGQTSGKINVVYTYTTSTTDPNGDQVYYMWDWGDGSQSNWLGPYNSGVTINTTHKWTIKGSYSIKVKAKDTFGAESSWSDPLPITMPYSYYKPILHFLELLFERFPHAFPILRQLLGY